MLEGRDVPRAKRAGGRKAEERRSLPHSSISGRSRTGSASICAWRRRRPFQAFSHRSQEIGESPGRFATLTLIARNPGISQTELSYANGRDKSSLTPVVEDLVRRGLVERKRMDNDRRAYRLNLTPAGKKCSTLMTRCARGHERNLDRVIGERDRKRFHRIA